MNTYVSAKQGLSNYSILVRSITFLRKIHNNGLEYNLLSFCKSETNLAFYKAVCFGNKNATEKHVWYCLSTRGFSFESCGNHFSKSWEQHSLKDGFDSFDIFFLINCQIWWYTYTFSIRCQKDKFLFCTYLGIFNIIFYILGIWHLFYIKWADDFL